MECIAQELYLSKILRYLCFTWIFPYFHIPIFSFILPRQILYLTYCHSQHVTINTTIILSPWIYRPWVISSIPLLKQVIRLKQKKKFPSPSPLSFSTRRSGSCGQTPPCSRRWYGPWLDDRGEHSPLPKLRPRHTKKPPSPMSHLQETSYRSVRAKQTTPSIVHGV